MKFDLHQRGAAAARASATALHVASATAPHVASALALPIAATLALLFASTLAVAAAPEPDIARDAPPARPVVIAGQPANPELRILTFNVEHLMSDARFEQWRAFCEPRGWKEPDEPDPAEAARPAELNYCNALDGTDGRGKRLFKPLRTEGDLADKRRQARQLIDAARPDVVLLQEVSDAIAAADLLGPTYRVLSSAELWREHRISQNVAIGYRESLPLHVGKTELVGSIAKPGPQGHLTRPGLAVDIELGGGRRLAILNLHLKAGCRMGRLDESPSRKPERAERRDEACSVFQQQVPAIEAWADARLEAGAGVIIAGDFNRDLMRELRDKLPARNDDSDSAKPVDDPRRIVGLLPELSDEEPRAAWFAVARPGPYPKHAECHRGIDGFLLSRNLQAWTDTPLTKLRAQPLPFAEPLSLDRVRPSDHCPHLLEFRLTH